MNIMLFIFCQYGIIMNDVYYNILLWLEFKDIYRCMCVDKNFYNICKSEVLWKHFYLENYKDMCLVGSYCDSCKIYRILRKYKSKLTLDRNSNLYDILCGGEFFADMPSEIGLLTNLTKMEFLNCKIATIPTTIGLLKNLKTINLWKNTICEIPTTIGSLSNLEYCNFDKNLIGAIPTTIGLLQKLKYLYISKNKIKIIPTEIGKLVWLQCLSINDNDIDEVPTELVLLEDIEYLYLHNNNIETIPQELEDRPYLEVYY